MNFKEYTYISPCSFASPKRTKRNRIISNSFLFISYLEFFQSKIYLEYTYYLEHCPSQHSADFWWLDALALSGRNRPHGMKYHSHEPGSIKDNRLKRVCDRSPFCLTFWRSKSKEYYHPKEPKV